MLFYYCVAAISCLFMYLSDWFSSKSSRLSWVFFVATVLLFCHLAGVRDLSVGTDTYNYGVIAFTTAATNDLDSFYHYSSCSGWEPLAKLVLWYSAHLTNSIYWYFFTMELFVVLPVLWSIKREKTMRSWFGVLIFALLFYPTSFNITRQMMGTGFLMLSFRPAAERRPIAFIVLVAIAAGFHYSQIMGLVIYPLVRFAYANQGGHSWTKLIILILGSITLVYLGAPILNYLTSHLGLYGSYTAWEFAHAGGGRRYAYGTILYCLVTFTLAWMFSEGEIMSRRETLSLLFLALFGALCLPLSFISFWFYRIGYTFLYFIMLFDIKASSEAGNTSNNMLFVMLIVALTVCWSFDCYVTQGRDVVVPFLFNQLL